MGADISPHLESYLTWIVEQYGLRLYRHLVLKLFDIPFHSAIRMDANRASDGIYMREEFIDHHPGSEYDVSSHLEGECSVLEFLAAFASRIDEATSYRKSQTQWMSYFLKNLGLIGFNDRFYADNPDRINDVNDAVAERVDRMLNRRYSYDGSHGGLFVLKSPPCDLRKVEYWWQMQYYVLERYMPRD